MKAAQWFALALLAFSLVVGSGFLLQRQTTSALRSELALSRAEHRELGQLQKENQKLKAAQVPAGELERLRADHAAIMRLRNEIEAMKARAEQAPQHPGP